DAQGRDGPFVKREAHELGRANRRAAHDQRTKRNQHDQAEICQRKAERQPESRDDARLPEEKGAARCHGRLFWPRLVDRVEDAAVTEKLRLYGLPTAEVLDGCKPQLRKALAVLNARKLRLGRPVVLLSSDPLPDITIEIFEIGGGNLGRAARPRVFFDERKGRAGLYWGCRANNSELGRAERIQRPG